MRANDSRGYCRLYLRPRAFQSANRRAGIYGLADYVSDRIMTDVQAGALKKAVIERKNILVAGAPVPVRQPWRMPCWRKLPSKATASS